MYEINEVIDLINRFLSGQDIEYEIDDFLSVKSSDALVEKIRLFILRTAQEFPAEGRGFASDTGLKKIKALIDSISQEMG